MLRSHPLRRTAIGALTGALTVCAFTFSARADDGGGAARAPLSAACAQVATPDQKKDAATLQRIEQAWLAAEYRGHREYLECLLEPDYHTSSRSGLVRSREEVIEKVSQVSDDAREVPKLETIVVIHGNSASAHSILETTDKAGKPKEVHFVDAYTFHDGRWYAFSGADL